MKELINPLYHAGNGIDVEYTALARKLGVDELLTPDVIRDTVHSGFRCLGANPDSVDLDGLKIKVGFAAGFHGGQGTYDGNGTIYLGAYQLLSDKVPTRILNMPDGEERADRYFSVVFTAGTTEAKEHFGHLLDEKTLSKLKDDITYVFGDISLDDFDIRGVESTLAHEINHYMRPRNKRVRDLYDIAFRETAGSVIGGVVRADSIDTRLVIKEASEYGYEKAREHYRPKPKSPPTLPEEVDIPPETRVHVNEQMRESWESQEDEPEFPRHLRRYCNRTAKHMADILLLGDGDIKIKGLNAASLRELERIAKSLPKSESEKELVTLT